MFVTTWSTFVVLHVSSFGVVMATRCDTPGSRNTWQSSLPCRDMEQTVKV